MGGRRWEMGDGRLEMGDGRLEIGDWRWVMVALLMPLSTSSIEISKVTKYTSIPQVSSL
jgi:hypothetical protein